MGLPPKVLTTGVTDMVRISDARMSGTAYGTAVLHVSPEAAAGGPLALVQDGDMIELDVEARRLHLDVSDDVLAARREAWRKPESVLPPGGYGSCTSITSSRPIREPIWIFSSAAAAMRYRGSHINRDGSSQFPVQCSQSLTDSEALWKLDMLSSIGYWLLSTETN